MKQQLTGQGFLFVILMLILLLILLLFVVLFFKAFIFFHLWPAAVLFSSILIWVSGWYQLHTSLQLIGNGTFPFSFYRKLITLTASEQWGPVVSTVFFKSNNQQQSIYFSIQPLVALKLTKCHIDILSTVFCCLVARGKWGNGVKNVL